MSRNMVVLGDCEKELENLINEGIKVKLIWTSPPYNLGNFKKGSFYNGKSKGDTLSYNSHDDMAFGDYILWQRQILALCYNLLTDDGAIFYNHKPRILDGEYDNRRGLIPFSIRQEIIWNRKSMINFTGTFFAPNTERIFIIAKEKWRPVKEYVGLGEVWEF